MPRALSGISDQSGGHGYTKVDAALDWRWGYTLIRAMGEPALTERRIAGDEGFNPHAQGAL